MEIITFNNFSKRNNSTKQPTETTGVTVTASLKDDTSIINPTFLLDRTALQNFDVSYVEALGHYYFVTDCKLNGNGLIELMCSMDVLASYKSDILANWCNILYTTDSSKNIIDHRIPVLSNVEVSDNAVAIDNLTITGYDNMGAVIIGVTGVGSFGTYLMQNSTQVKSLLDGVENFNTNNIKDTVTGLIQLVSSGYAPDNLKSAIALPLALDGGEFGTLDQIHLGLYPCTAGSSFTPIYGFHINKPIISRVTNVGIPWKYSDWRRNSPYSEVVLYLPFIGVVSLPTSDIINENTLTVQYSINVTSGDIAVSVKGASSGRILSTSSGNIAMSTAYGSSGIDTTKLTTTAIGGLGAIGAGAVAASTGGAGLAVLGVLGGLGTVAKGTLDSIAQNTGGSGGLGGGASQGLDRVIHCFVVSRTLTDEPSHFAPVMGKPFMGVGTPGQHLGGFFMANGFSVECAADEPVKKEINSLVDSGIYID